jgi:hypothetical protein
MGSSKSSLSKIQREKFLRDHGFEFDRTGAGDHNIWVHRELRALALKGGIKIDCPQNLLHNPNQLPWEHCIPDNPATGTWTRIANHAKWCSRQAEEIRTAAAKEEARRKLVEEFHSARDEMCQWRREMKHRYKANLDMSESRPAPVTWQELNAMQAKLGHRTP